MRDFFWGKREKPFLVLDVEDDSIKSLILRKDKNKLVLLGNALERYGENDLKEKILKAIEGSYNNYIFFSNKQERNKYTWENIPVLLGLPSSVLKARVISCNFNRNNRSKISKKEEVEILKKALRMVKSKIGNEFVRDFGILPEDIRYTNFKILETDINGYLVSNLFGFEGQNLNLKVLATFIPQNDLINIKSTLDSLGIKVSKIMHIAEALSESGDKVIYPKDLKNIKNLSRKLENSSYTPTLLMSYYAKEIL